MKYSEILICNFKKVSRKVVQNDNQGLFHDPQLHPSFFSTKKETFISIEAYKHVRCNNVYFCVVTEIFHKNSMLRSQNEPFKAYYVDSKFQIGSKEIFCICITNQRGSKKTCLLWKFEVHLFQSHITVGLTK